MLFLFVMNLISFAHANSGWMTVAATHSECVSINDGKVYADRKPRTLLETEGGCERLSTVTNDTISADCEFRFRFVDSEKVNSWIYYPNKTTLIGEKMIVTSSFPQIHASDSVEANAFFNSGVIKSIQYLRLTPRKHLSQIYPSGGTKSLTVSLEAKCN